MNKIMNWQGKMIDPLNIDREFLSDLKMIGIQCGTTLSRVGRFWSQTVKFYSVANHVLSMVKVVESMGGSKDLLKWAISHELYEALTGIDLPSPLKSTDAYKMYKESEIKCLNDFADLHNMSLPMPKEIKRIDKSLMVMEGIGLMPKTSSFDWRRYGEPIGELYKLGYDMDEIKNDFILKWEEIFEL